MEEIKKDVAELVKEKREASRSITAALAETVDLINQRFLNRIYVTYVFSWISINWNLALPLFFGERGFDERFATFESGMVEALNPYYIPIFGPIALTLFLLFVIPPLKSKLHVVEETNYSKGLKIANDKICGKDNK